MQSQLFVADAIEFNADPAAHSDVGRPVKLPGRLLDQHFLNADCRRDYHCHVPIVVMVNRAGGKDLLFNEKGRFTMRDFFPGFRLGKTNATNTLHVLLLNVSRLRFCYYVHVQRAVFKVTYNQRSASSS